MSRIHEALQKAAERATDAMAVGSDAFTGEADVPDHANESFPIELNEHRRHKPATVTALPAPVVMPPLAGAASGERRRGDSDETGPLSFERLDARLAGKIVIDQEISAASREQYRRLAANLHHAQAATGLKVVMVTSAVMGEGKTLTASNLALTLSESYQKNVLLLDADLRRPALHTIFRVRNEAGLSEGLIHSAERKVPVHQVSSRLGILAAGRPTSDPIAGLTSARMRTLLDEARAAFDWIILDTPPVALLPDANLLASMVDGAIVVVRAGVTPFDLVQRAVSAIGRDRVLGVVLNSATEPAHGVDYYGYEYYARTPIAQGEARSSP
jgi:protein-tyrosine kinase